MFAKFERLGQCSLEGEPDGYSSLDSEDDRR